MNTSRFHYFEELMTGILKDFSFTIAYLDNITIFSKTPQEHLSNMPYNTCNHPLGPNKFEPFLG